MTDSCPPPTLDMYPGTNRQIIAPRDAIQLAAEPLDPNRWDAHPREYTVRGRTVQFFPIGALAKALNRKARTVRQWEVIGLLPVSPWRSPSEHERGKQRLYSRELIEAIVQIAREEGVLHPYLGANISQTAFRDRVYELFVRVFQAESTAAKAWSGRKT
jgi:hypothetical protein